MHSMIDQAYIDIEKYREAKDIKGKYKPTLVPGLGSLIKAIAKVREFGITKYNDPDNWKRVPVEHYRDAMARHMIAYLDNPQSRDKESNLPHLWHCACNIAFLLYLEVWDE